MVDIIIELTGLNYFTLLKYHIFLRFPVMLFIRRNLVHNYRFRKGKHLMPFKTWITHTSLLEESAQSHNLSAKGEELSELSVM